MPCPFSHIPCLQLTKVQRVPPHPSPPLSHPNELLLVLFSASRHLSLAIWRLLLLFRSPFRAPAIASSHAPNSHDDCRRHRQQRAWARRAGPRAALRRTREDLPRRRVPPTRRGHRRRRPQHGAEVQVGPAEIADRQLPREGRPVASRRRLPLFPDRPRCLGFQQARGLAGFRSLPGIPVRSSATSFGVTRSFVPTMNRDELVSGFFLC